MSGGIGGSIQSINLAGTYFSVDAEADSGRKLGGFENEFKPNGDGTGRTVKKRVGWSLSDLSVGINDTKGDAERLQALANELDDFPVTVTYASGKVYQGVGQIQGEISTGAQETSASISLAGPGELTPQ